MICRRYIGSLEARCLCHNVSGKDSGDAAWWPETSAGCASTCHSATVAQNYNSRKAYAVRSLKAIDCWPAAKANVCAARLLWHSGLCWLCRIPPARLRRLHTPPQTSRTCTADRSRAVLPKAPYHRGCNGKGRRLPAKCRCCAPAPAQRPSRPCSRPRAPPRPPGTRRRRAPPGCAPRTAARHPAPIGPGSPPARPGAVVMLLPSQPQTLECHETQALGTKQVPGLCMRGQVPSSCCLPSQHPQVGGTMPSQEPTSYTIQVGKAHALVNGTELSYRRARWRVRPTVTGAQGTG